MTTDPRPAEPVDLDDPVLRDADAAAVLGRLADGGRLDPGVAGRVRARAERVTEGIRQVSGVVDDDTFQTLLDDEA